MASSSGWFPLDELKYFQSSSSSSTSSEDEELISLRMEKETQEMLNYIPRIYQAYTAQSSHRRYINRDREGSHQQLWNDYFSDNCTYPTDLFRRRFRMRRELFFRILNDAKNHNSYFTRKRDACGRLGLSSIQKITAALRILAYGFSADHCDEYLKIGGTTAITSLKEFCSSIIELYEEQYMRSPNEHDIVRLLQEGESRGFPDSNKDINVLDHSPLFDQLIHGRMPPTNYTVNGHSYTMGYYLTDGIYPKYATLIQSIPHPTTSKEKLFATKQESIRKDVERAFGVLQIRWGITQGPIRYWSKEDLCKIMKTCIILHNMIIEDECETEYEIWTPLPEENIFPPQYGRDPSILASYISARLGRIRNRGTNEVLRSDLMNHLWNFFGDEVA